jgi:hypothetical protein
VLLWASLGVWAGILKDAHLKRSCGSGGVGLSPFSFVSLVVAVRSMIVACGGHLDNDISGPYDKSVIYLADC